VRAYPEDTIPRGREADVLAVVSAEGMMFLLVGILYWTVLIGASLFLLWTLYLLNKYLRLRLAQLREERAPVPQAGP
jgi:hypothetical protein